MTKKLIAQMFVLLMFAGCVDLSPNSGTASVNARSENGQCPSKKTGTGLPGAPCYTFEDCTEVCCRCPSERQIAAAACVNGVCDTQAGTCERGRENYPLLCK